MVFIYITCKDKAEAKKISKHLLEKRLIACANMFPVESSYWWGGNIADDNEYVMFVKTKKSMYGKIVKEVENIHSYSVPCICMLESSENKEYCDWVKKEVK